MTFAGGLVFAFVAIALFSTTISGLVKLIFFFKQKDTFPQLVKFGILGEVVGLILIFAIWVLFKQEINEWRLPELLLSIPFFTMLVGQLIGFFITYRKSEKLKAVL